MGIELGFCGLSPSTTPVGVALTSLEAEEMVLRGTAGLEVCGGGGGGGGSGGGGGGDGGGGGGGGDGGGCSLVAVVAKSFKAIT